MVCQAECQAAGTSTTCTCSLIYTSCQPNKFFTLQMKRLVNYIVLSVYVSLLSFIYIYILVIKSIVAGSNDFALHLHIDQVLCNDRTVINYLCI